MLKNKKGYSMIEIMVTVLLIAILSAAAVPQYMKVIEKQKGVEAVNILAAIGKAEERYFVINEVYSKDFSDLDADLVDFDTGKLAGTDTASSFKTRSFTFTLSGTAETGTDAGKTTAERRDGSYRLIRTHVTGEICCGGDSDKCDLFSVTACT
jgi:prepilin-type N-terminal cleavage/methylation domain-containing protein